MSLLARAMEGFVLLVPRAVPDGEGGQVTTWEDGQPFRCALALASSAEARIAAVIGAKDVYTAYARKGSPLACGAVFRRVRDGRCFRCTSNGPDRSTPGGAALDVEACACEPWEPEEVDDADEDDGGGVPVAP